MANDPDRISSSNEFYTLGDLSKFPLALDREGELYTAINSGITKLSAPISFESSSIPVKDAEGFPSSGLIVIDEEIIYYSERGPRSFNGLIRGFSGKRSPHNLQTEVKAAVCSDHHNSVRDAILKVQSKVGLDLDVNGTTIFGRLKALEDRFLTLKAVFASYHYRGQSGEVFSFKDRSIGTPVTWIWDFGDGSTSTEQNPTHSYKAVADGSYQEYDVSLQVTDNNGSTSSVQKKGLIKIGAPKILIYSDRSRYSLLNNKVEATFIDQSQGIPLERRWTFGDGSEYKTEDPAENQVKHIYVNPGIYEVSLVVKMPKGSTQQQLLRSTTTVEVVK